MQKIQSFLEFCWNILNKAWSVLKFLTKYIYLLVKNKIFWIIVMIVAWTLTVAYFFSHFYLQGPIKHIEWQCVVCRYSDSRQIRNTQPSTPQSNILIPTQAVEEPKVTPPAIKKVGDKYVLHGIASHYNTNGCLGCGPNRIMANGEKLVDGNITVALTPEVVKKYSLMNQNVRITNSTNGAIAIARVTDTGGFGQLNPPRIADLTDGTRDALSCGGLCEVEISF